MPRIAKTESLTPRDFTKGRLQFVIRFLGMIGATYEEAAAACGVSRNALSHWFSTGNDCQLKYVIAIFDHFGYDLRIELFRQPGDLDIPFIADGSHIMNGPSRQTVFKPLTFLDVAMQRYGVTKIQLAEKLGLTPASVRYWWNEQNLMMSRLDQIAAVLDCNLQITVKPKVEIPALEPGQIARISHIYTNEVTIWDRNKSDGPKKKGK